MDDMLDRHSQVMPSAAPTEQEILDWERLSREEQLHGLHAALTHPDCETVSAETMSDILAEARASFLRA